MRFKAFAGFAVLGVVISGGVARAEGASFGGAKQLVLTDDLSIGNVAQGGIVTPTPSSSFSAASFQYASVGDNGGSGTALAFAPAVDYFVMNGLSLGTNVLVGVISPAHPSGTQDLSETIFGVAPRIGYDIPISETVSFWPKVFVGYVTVSASSGGQSSGSDQTAIGVYAPFMFEPARHFLIGIGPNVSTQLSSNRSSGNTSVSQSKVTTFGAQITLGGWVLGE